MQCRPVQTSADVLPLSPRQYFVIVYVVISVVPASHEMSRRLTDSDKLRSFVIVTCSGTAMFAGLNIYQGNEKFYREVAMPLLRFIEPETAHNLALTALKWGLVPKNKSEDCGILKTTVWGLKFENPVGMAAGFDKQGEAVKGLTKTGFGFVEIGKFVV